MCICLYVWGRGLKGWTNFPGCGSEHSVHGKEWLEDMSTFRYPDLTVLHFTSDLLRITVVLLCWTKRWINIPANDKVPKTCGRVIKTSLQVSVSRMDKMRISLFHTKKKKIKKHKRKKTKCLQKRLKKSILYHKGVGIWLLLQVTSGDP